MKNLILIETRDGKHVIEHTLTQLQVLTAQPGAVYTLVDKGSQTPPQGLVLKRKGNHLEAEVEQQLVARIEGFYDEDMAAIYSLDGSLTPADGMLLGSADASLAASGAEGEVVWQAAGDESSGLTAFNIGLGAISIIGGGVALAGGGGSSDSTSATSATAASASTNYDLTVAAAAGPFQSAMAVEVYDKAGKLLATGEYNAGTGQFKVSISSGYRGPLLVVLIDINGDAGDYLDEASNELLSLGGSLRAMAYADGKNDVHVSVTPLTELAVRIAGISGHQVTEDNLVVNDLIAKLFGVSNILAPVVTVVEDSYNPEDGISEAENYGNVLALLSGVAQHSGGLSSSLAQLRTGIMTQENGNLAMTQATVERLASGVDAFLSGANADKAALTQELIELPVIAASSGGINATEKMTGVEVGIKGVQAGDTVTLQWGSQVYISKIVAEDINSAGGALLTVPGSVVEKAGDGTVAVSYHINDRAESPAVLIAVDTIGPAAPTMSLAVDSGSSANDGISQQGSINVGLASDVSSWQYSLDGGASWNTGTDSSFELADNTTYAIGDVQVRQTDKAGNTSPSTRNPAAITIDTTAPTITISGIGLSHDTGHSDSDFITHIASQTITATLSDGLEAGDILFGSLDGGSSWTDISAKITGTAINWEGAILSGSSAIQFKVTDAAGNDGTVASQDYVLDTGVAAPGFALANDSGSSATDQLTHDATVTVTLAADVASWQYSLDGGASWNSGSGSRFELTDNTTYAIGEVQVRQTDTAGNLSAATSNPAAITIDNTAPTTTLSGITLSHDTGSSDSDFITHTVSQTITATLSAALAEGDILYGSLDGGSTWADISAKVTGQALSWEGATLSGSRAIQFKVTDAAGNDGAVASQAYVLDTSVAAPSFALASDSGSSGSDNLSHDATVTVTLADDVDGWQYSLDGGASWLAGSATSFELADNTTYAIGDVRVRQTDIAGNISPVTSNTVQMITDQLPPVAPSFALANDTGSSATDQLTHDATINVTLADEVASWQYSLDGGASWNTGTDSSFELADNTTYAIGDVQVRQTDKAGNTSPSTRNPAAITIDTTAPTITISGIGLSHDTGHSDSDFITHIASQTITATLSDGLEAGDILFGSLDGGSSWTDISAKITGTAINWEGAILSGSSAIQFKVTDAAGNDGTVASQDYVLDTGVAAPGFALANDSGSSATDQLTHDATVTVTLAADVDGWQYSLDGGNNWSSGTSTRFELADNTTYAIGDVQVRQTDVAGNTSPATSNTAAITTDMTAPTTLISGIRLSHDTGRSDGDFITHTVSQTITATLSDGLEAGDILYGSLDSGTTWLDVTSSVSGTTVSWEGAILLGSSAIQFKVTDAAGNDGAVASQAYVLDTSVAAPSFALASDSGSSGSDNLSHDATINVTLADDVDGWQYSLDGGNNWSSGTGNRFELADNTTYAIGDVQVRQTDIAGNTSPVTNNTVQMITDQLPPVAPSFALANDTGSSATDQLTHDATINVTLADEVASWQYSLDGGASWNTGTDSSFELADNTTYAIGDVQVRQTDKAGNTSPATRNTVEMTTDMIAPAAPSFALANDTGSSPSEQITNDATVNVTLADDMDSWQYSLDGGNTWSVGSGTDFELSDNTRYELGAIQVRQLDYVGNASDASSNNLAITIDTAEPVVSNVILSDTALKVGDTATLIIVFSEAVTGFDNSDITLANGTLSAVTSSDGGITWTGTFTPTDDIEDASNVIRIGTGFTDLAGNAPLAGKDSANYAIDTTEPVVSSVTLSATELKVGETAILSIVFSEAVTGFDNSDITLANGTLSAVTSSDGGITWTGTFTPTDDIEDASNVIRVGTGFTDLAGNAPLVGKDSANYVIDTAEPVVSNVILSDTALKVGDTATLIIVFSEAVTGFGNSDITLANGTLSAVTSSDGGITWTGTFTPTDDIEDATNVIRVGTGFTDLAGNAPLAGKDSANYAIDTTEPVVSSVTLSATELKVGDTATLIIVFSEAVTGFDNSDITLANGTLSAVTSSDGGITWTGTFTPTDDIEDASNVIRVGTGFTDLAGNAPLVGKDSANYVIDTAEPVVSNVILSDTALKVGDTATLIIVFSEAVTGFDNSDITLANGTLSDVTSTDNITWTGTFTPSDDIEAATNVISVGTTFTDLSGNAPLAGKDSANYAIDTTEPVVSRVTLSDSALKVGDTATLTIVFSEAVKDFDNSDVTLANGTLSAVTSSDGGITWTGTFTPSDNIEAAENVISVGTTFTDLAGNAPLAGKDSANYVIDTKAPSVSISSSAAALKAGETATLTFTFSEAPTDFSADDVSVDSGALSAFTVTGDPRVYTANYTPAVDTEDATMAVSVGSGYSDEAGNTGTGNSLQLEVDTQAPTVAITSSAAALKAGETATLTFTFSEAPTDFSADDVSVDSGALSAFTVTGDPRVYTATYTPAVDTENATMAVSVGTSYSDAAGNTGTGNSLQLEVDTKAPTLTSSSPADDATNVAVDSDITLTFNEDIALGTGNIVITDGTHTITIDVANHGGQLSVAGKELTINPTVDLANHGATYNVQVAPGAVTDAAGNGYAGITDETTLDFETAPINVVFDLTSGKSSSGGDSERNFEAGQKYVIYIKVHSTSEALTWDGTEQWNGATHLGADDKIVLTGNGAEVGGKLNNSVINHELAANSVAWRSSQHQAFAIHNDGRVERYFGGETGQVISVSALWTGNWGVRPNSNVTLGQAYMTALPTSIALPV